MFLSYFILHYYLMNILESVHELDGCFGGPVLGCHRIYCFPTFPCCCSTGAAANKCPGLPYSSISVGSRCLILCKSGL